MLQPSRFFVLRLFPGVLLLGSLLQAPAHAADDPAARKILDATVAKNSAGFQTGQSTTLLTLRLQNGKEKTWQTLARVARKDAKLRTRVTFLAPADSVGVELLMLEQGRGQTTQYLYLPKTRRLRRMGGSDRNSAFMGTDFSFGDLEGRGLQVGEAKKLGAEVIGGVPCTKIDVRSQDPEDPYGHVEIWVDEAKSVARQMKFYGKDGAHQKTLIVDEVAEVEGRATLKKFRMLSHVRGSVTTVTTQAIDTRAALPDALFEPESLGR